MPEYTLGEPDIRRKLESIRSMRKAILSSGKDDEARRKALKKLEEEEAILKSAPPVSEFDEYELLGYYGWLRDQLSKGNISEKEDPFIYKKTLFDLNILEREIKRRGLWR